MKYRGKRLELTNEGGQVLVVFEEGATKARAIVGGMMAGFQVLDGWGGFDNLVHKGELSRPRVTRKGGIVAIPSELWEGKPGGLTGDEMASVAADDRSFGDAQAAWVLYRSGGATLEEIAPLLDKALGVGAK